jgi:OPA family glycerol-3-phosphate transporter-like MFS transporter
LGAIFVAWKMLDRPESVGLPPIQEYHRDLPNNTIHDTDETAFELFRNYVLKNPRIWMLSVACMLIYMVRYGLGDWGITYLTEMKASSVGWASFKSSFLELMGIPGTILAGYIADRFFSRQNLVVAFIYLIAVCGTIFLIFYIPKGYGTLDAVTFGLAGFFLYGAQMVCTGLGPLSMVPRRAVASAVGLTGAMSYLGAVITSSLSGWMTDHWGWQSTFFFWAVCAVAAMLVLIPLIVHRENTLI